MHYYYDTEFLEDGRTIELISIGVAAEDGREYYAINSVAPWRRIGEHPWLIANVVPHLPMTAVLGGGMEIDRDHPSVKLPDQIAANLIEFFGGWDPVHPGAAPVNVAQVELWAYYAAYDHVALCQLFGRMLDLPSGMPMWTNDLQQELRRVGVTKKHIPIAEPAQEHNALSDARWVRDVHQWMLKVQRGA